MQDQLLIGIRSRDGWWKRQPLLAVSRCLDQRQKPMRGKPVGRRVALESHKLVGTRFDSGRPRSANAWHGP